MGEAVGRHDPAGPAVAATFNDRLCGVWPPRREAAGGDDAGDAKQYRPTRSRIVVFDADLDGSTVANSVTSLKSELIERRRVLAEDGVEHLEHERCRSRPVPPCPRPAVVIGRRLLARRASLHMRPKPRSRAACRLAHGQWAAYSASQMSPRRVSSRPSASVRPVRRALVGRTAKLRLVTPGSACLGDEAAALQRIERSKRDRHGFVRLGRERGQSSTSKPDPMVGCCSRLKSAAVALQSLRPVPPPASQPPPGHGNGDHERADLVPAALVGEQQVVTQPTARPRRLSVGPIISRKLSQ